MAEIKNPNLEPGADKRLIIVFAMTFLAVVIGQAILAKYAPKPEQKPEQKPAVTAPAAPAKPASTLAPSAAKPGMVAAKQKEKAPAVETKRAAVESDTVIENDLYRITFTNRGAQVKSWLLKKHKDDKGGMLDLVNAEAAPKFGYPLSLFTYDEGLREKLNSVLYVTNSAGTETAPATIHYEYADGDLVVSKTFSFDHSYVVKIETSVRWKGSEVAAYPAWPSGLGDVGFTPEAMGPAYAATHLMWTEEDKVIRLHSQEGTQIFGSKKWVSDGNTHSAPFTFAGVSDQYFAAIFLPDKPENAAMVQFHKTIPRDPAEKDEEKRKKEVFSILGAAVGSPSGPTSTRLFVGPKDLEVLQSVKTGSPVQPDLEHVVDFGMFRIIAKPLFMWLKWTKETITRNWGWAIMLTTFVINLALFPMRYSSMKSALKMQKIQPEVTAINRRYQGLKLTDPRQQEKQREVQELYKREGINPIGGCLPMLLQLPFLFAFYAMLSAANELRHAEWLWVKDLASADATHVLPVLIIATMFIMQRITPMTGMDPAQARMMQVMMPVMMGFLFWSLPAGLGVYILTGNVVGYVTQYFMNRSRAAMEVKQQIAKREEKKKKK